MQNKVPATQTPKIVPDAGFVAARTVDRSLRVARESAESEINRLIEAAFVLIQRRRELEPRVSEIVSEAGLHNQAFYRHFRSKHELLVAVLERGVGILAGYLRHRMASADSGEEQVREWVSGVLEQALDADGAEATRPFVLARATLMRSFPDEVAEAELQLTALLRTAIVAAKSEGSLLAADPERDSETLYLLAMGWVHARLVESSLPSRESAEHLASFAMAGLDRVSRFEEQVEEQVAEQVEEQSDLSVGASSASIENGGVS